MGHLSPDYQDFVGNYPRNARIRPAAAYVLKRAEENASLEEILNLIQGHGCGGISSTLIATKEEEKVFYRALKIINEKNSDKRWVIPATAPESPHLSNAHFIEYAYWGIQNAHLQVNLKETLGVRNISINHTPLSKLYFGTKPTVPFIHPYHHEPNPYDLKLFGWVNQRNSNSQKYGICIQKLTHGEGPQQLKPHYALAPNAPHFQEKYNVIFNTHAIVLDSNNHQILNERGDSHIHAGESYNLLSPPRLFSINIQQGQHYISKVIYNNQQFITFHWILTEEENQVFNRVIGLLNNTQIETLEELMNLILIESYDNFRNNKNFNALRDYLGIFED